ARDDLFYPVSPTVRRLQEQVGNSTLLVLGEDTIPPNANMVYRLHLLTGYDGLWVRHQRRLYRALFDAPPGALSPSMKAEPRALQMFGVEYVATVGQDDRLAKNSDFELLWRQDQLSLYRYLGSLTRYYTVDSAWIVENNERAWELVRAAEFDPSRAVLLIGDSYRQPTRSERSAQPAEVLVQRAEYVKLRVARDRPGYLVLAMTYYPGWKAKVNAEPQAVLRANFAFSAVALPAGESVIEFYYDPDSVKLGAALSIFGLVLTGVLVITQGLRRSSSPAS
ncbi:MAG: YfhO family protein, partial [Anaerolineae bacterium]|nr:YfhO family protein [Thermoflexales bacterium]MDW8408951.1 YfhO family protein [Anaerolineae bacterium]